MEITINTPALLFPAISLLMLAYTNRFLALASLIRNLHSNYKNHTDKEGVLKQIKNLRLRLKLIRQMQLFGVLSLFLCVLSMFFVYERFNFWANFLFAFSRPISFPRADIAIVPTNITVTLLDSDQLE